VTRLSGWKKARSKLRAPQQEFCLIIAQCIERKIILELTVVVVFKDLQEHIKPIIWQLFSSNPI
jgi:hypothetical protein